MAGIVGYRLGGAKILPASLKLIVGSVERPVRPKTFAVLVYLIENHHRVVSKDEFIREVWQGVAVGDDSIVQCIGEARRLLGDNSQKPRFIRTASKSGYQYIGPVEPFDPTQEFSAAAVIDETDTLEVEVEEEVVDEVFPPVPRFLPAPRRSLLWLLLIPCLAGAALVFYFLRQSPRETLPRAEAGWWKFDGPVTVSIPDTSGHGQTGTLSGMSQAEPGTRSALRLGQNTYISGHDARSLPSGDTPRSLTAWVKMDSPRIQNGFVFSYGSAEPGHTAKRFDFGVLTSGRVGFGSDIQGGWMMGKLRVDDQKWHMISATYGGPDRTTRIYIDGELDSAGTLMVPPASERPADWRIGQSLIGSGAFQGAISELRVYDWSLDAAQLKALYRCSAAFQDLDGYYYLPVLDAGVAVEPRPPGEDSARLQNSGKQLAGMQLANRGHGCGPSDWQGADVGQDLRISVELHVPAERGLISEAGPYIRARRSKSGETEGMMFGGESAGYWVALHSNGMLKVKCMNPPAVIGFTPAAPEFNPTVFHRLELEAKGDMLSVWLDGKSVVFEQNGDKTAKLRIPPPPRHGQNQGAAGIIFGNEYNRDQIGGQEARNLRIVRLDR